MKRASIRVQEPTPELIEKIRRARVAISQQKPRYLKCPYCQHNAIAVYPDVMSIEQMCEILSISTKTGYRILREGKICCLKVGRAYRIPKAHLFTFLCIGCGEAVTA